MGTVVVGVDGSGQSRSALRRAAEEADVRGGSLDAVYVYAPSTADIAEDAAALLESRGSAGQGARDEHARSSARTKLADIVADELGARARNVRLSVVADHDVAETLIDRASGAEVLVIGIRRRSRVGKFILGSTAQEIILNATCPVLTVAVDWPSESGATDPRGG